MVDWGAIAGAAITALASFAGVYAANKKQTALMAYRLEQLEKKVDKHNSLVERMTKVETQLADLQKGA